MALINFINDCVTDSDTELSGSFQNAIIPVHKENQIYLIMELKCDIQMRIVRSHLEDESTTKKSL